MFLVSSSSSLCPDAITMHGELEHVAIVFTHSLPASDLVEIEEACHVVPTLGVEEHHVAE